LIREEDAARINTALDKLSETQKRRLLMLADGLSVNEIARIEDIAPNAAWKSIESAKKKFKKHF
jgi:DNA-binding CsgD family transcriptional regulator